MSYVKRTFLFAACAALSLAVMPTLSAADEKDGLSPLQPGTYQMTLSDPFGTNTASCWVMRGVADATIQDRAVTTPLFKSLELWMDRNGDISGEGAETLSGWNVRTTFQGKQTNSGYSGEFSGRLMGSSCGGNWVLTRGIPLESGVYTLTVRDRTKSEKLSCNRLEGTDELDVDEGRGSPGIFAGLRFTVFPNGSLSARGFETVLYSMPANLTGKKSATGYEGEYTADKLGYRCSGTWSLVKHK